MAHNAERMRMWLLKETALCIVSDLDNPLPTVIPCAVDSLVSQQKLYELV